MLFVPGLVAIGQSRGFTALTATGAATLFVIALPLAAFAVRRPEPGFAAPSTALGVLAVLDVLAVVGVLWGRRAGPPFDSPTPTR